MDRKSNMEPDKTISKTINITATPAKIWNALTNPELIKLWMSDAELEIISGWVIGSPIILKTNLNGKHEFKGKILQMEPGKIFQYSSWSKISRLPDIPENYSLIEFRLTPMENQTSLSVTHSNLIAKAAVEHSNYYWNIALELIRRLVER